MYEFLIQIKTINLFLSTKLACQVYKFAKKLKTVKKKLEILLGSNTLIFYKVLR